MNYLPTPDLYHKYWYIDIETEAVPDFRPNKIWMMCASRMDQAEVHHFVGHQEIKRFFDELKGQEVYFVGHNSISFDGPVTDRVLQSGTGLSNTVDTLVLSYLYDPAMLGGHSLEAWGNRLKDPKGDFHDWSGYSEEMAKYCEQDVKLGKKVAKALWTRLRRMGFSELSCWIEHHIRDVLNEQQRNGWYFDVAGAQALVSHLRSEQSGLEAPIRELFPPRLTDIKTYERRTKKDGTDFASYLRHVEEFPDIRFNDDGTYTTLGWEEFNIGSPQQRCSRLLERGYEPSQYTPSGNPKVDEESLLAFAETSGLPEVKAIAEWLVLQGRSTMVEGWLNNVNYDDSCIHGLVFTCAATTRRMIHRAPNTANIPKAKLKVKYGIECRRLWRARPGRVQVGADASGLELRMFAQYLNDPEATKLYTEGDPHMFNTRLLELPDEARDGIAKTIIYGLLYGARDKKLGRILQPTLNDRAAASLGPKARKKLQNGIPGLDRLVEEIQYEFNNSGGNLRCIDGGFVRCPSEHAAINYKLQSAGAIVMKMANILARDEIRRLNLDALQVGNVHDELQYDVRKEHAEEVGRVLVWSIEEAGRRLGFHVPLTGEYKVGLDWASTH